MANDAVYEVNIKLNAQNFEAELDALKTKLERFTKDAKRKNEKDPIFKKGRQLTVLKSIQSTQNKLNELNRFNLDTSKQQVKLDQAKELVDKGKFRTAKNLVSEAQLLNLKDAENLRLAKERVAEEKRLAREKEKQLRLDKSRRQAIIKSAAIGGGFPLLFGGGLGQSIPGAIGGALGEAASPGGGFAGSIAATALTAELTKIGQASLETAKKMGTLNGKLALARERFLFTSDETEELARQLERQGKVQELNNLLSKEYQQIVGNKGVENLNKLNEVSSEFSRLMGILKTNFDAFIAGPLTKLLKFLNNVLGQDVTSTQFKNLRNNLTGTERENFEARLKELRKEAGGGKTGGAITDSIRRQLMGEFGAKPLADMGVKNNKLFKEQINLGKDRLADLDKEIEKANLKNTLSEREFEAEMRIQEIMKGTTGLTRDQVKAKLDKLYVLSQEQEKLQKTKELYDSIGNSIEKGIVDAINGAIEGTKTLGDVARSVFREIQRSLISFGVNAFLGGLIPGFPGRAEGGPVTKGRGYIVGERGPELFTPGSSGNITPNHQLGGSTNVVVNVDASGSSVEGDEQRGKELGRLISVAIQSELIQQKRPGGLLA